MKMHAALGRDALARLLLLLALGVAGFLALCSPVRAYTFGEPDIRPIGPEQTVFDWSTESCEDVDIPDNPARAFRDNQNRVQLIASHATVWRSIGLDLHSVQRSCDSPVMTSHGDPDASNYNDKEWLMSTYTHDGQTVHGLAHVEYQGWSHPGMGCAGAGGDYTQMLPCWYNAVTAVKSSNGGASYQHVAPPGHLVASVPDRYTAGAGPYGIMAPSNIIKGRSDENYYSLVLQIEPNGLDNAGVCLMRTSDPNFSPTSWRAWDGTGFNVRFINPYLETPPSRAPHLCKKLDNLSHMSQSLTYSTYLNKYVVVGNSIQYDPARNANVTGFFYSLSEDLLHWSVPKLLVEGELVQTHQCGDADPIRDPALLDPTSTSRNFETIGRRPYLYFKRFNYWYDTPTNCWQTLDRDLIRVPIEFAELPSPPPPPPPPPPGPPGPAQQPLPTATGVGGPTPPAPSATACDRAREKRVRLRKLVTSTRRKLARARSPRKKKQYRRQLRSLNRQLQRIAACSRS